MKIILTISFLMFILFGTSDWSMYPNPAKDHFTVEAEDGELLPYVRIYDMQGRLMQQEYIGTGVSSKLIYIHLKPGKYIVYLDDK
jgi:hypothetical protein